jgi:hypothetical protein
VKAVSDEAYGATVAKRKLARRLYELRRVAGHTANHVCDLLDWGRGKLGRFEANQWRRPEMSDIRDLLRVYGVTSGMHDEIMELAARARVKPWWRDYNDVFDNEFPGFENDAVEIRVFMPLVLPGLLQTNDYMEAVLRTGPRSPAFQQKAIDSRLRRQEILGRTDETAPKLIAVITEASLMYHWGTRAQRLEQVEHLIDLSHRPNVELHIQRFTDGPPVGMHSMVDILELPDGEPRVVYLETDMDIQEVTKQNDIAGYVESFGRAREAALEPLHTAAYLRHLTEELE